MVRLVRLLALLLLGLLFVPVASTPVDAAAQSWTVSPQDERTYIANINAIREANGMRPLTLDKNMRSAARDWTAWMADNTTLQHADDIVTGAPADWLKVGENVGRGGSVESVWDAFLASPSHRANLLDPDYDLVGVGVLWTADGRLYTTHRFASTESGQQPAPQPAPTATPPPQPTATPAPQPTATPLPPPQPTATQPPAAAPDQLLFTGTETTSPAPAPADRDRLTLTITLLLDAGG